MAERRIVVRHGYGTSLTNVAEDVAEVLRKKYGLVFVVDHISFTNTVKQGATHIIHVTVIDPVFSRGQLSLMRFICRQWNVKCCFYTTTEGRILADEGFLSIFDSFDIVANSQYTAKKIEETGLKVNAVVYHGVSESKVMAVFAYRHARKELRDIFKNKVIFFVVMSTRRRKGWKEFLESWKLVNKEVRKNSVVLYISEKPLQKLIEEAGLSGEFVNIADMGRLEHWKVMLFMYASDFLIFPSLAEGFGLPLLEATAVGTPSIANKLPPFTEFAHPKTFFVEPVKVEYYRPRGEPVGGIEYELHFYRPEDMAKKIEEAFYFYINERDEYEALRKELMEYAKQFYTDRVYSWFIKWIEGEA